MLYTIRELKVEEDGETGIQAISFVDSPAIETDFEYFNAHNKVNLAKSNYFTYTGPNDDATRDFCKARVGKTFSVEEIRSWSNGNSNRTDLYFQEPQQKNPQQFNLVNAPTDAMFFKNFDSEKGGPDYQNNYTFNCDAQMFGCRHHLIRAKAPVSSPFNQSKETFVSIIMTSEPKREVQGLVLKSSQMIYRNDVDGNGNPGYIYFSRETVRKLKEKYGYNRSISYMHRDDLTGQAILLDSWLEEDNHVTSWFVKYKILGDKLWEQIKRNVVKGFSVEALFSIN